MTDDLRKLAQAATPGPWHWDADPVKGDPLSRYRAQVTSVGRTITKSYYTEQQGERDAALIAAANPTKIIELLDTIDRLTAENEEHLKDKVALAMEVERQRKLLEKAKDVLWDAKGNINPERGFAIELEEDIADTHKAITQHLQAKEGERHGL